MTDTESDRRRPGSRPGDDDHRPNLGTPGGAPTDDADERRKGFVRLMIFLAVATVLAARFGVLKTVLVVVAVIACIMLHELGHFVTARLTGMKATEFFVGFGPRVWSVRKGETEYGVKAIPAGGYVRIIGMNNLEEVDPADEARTYRQQAWWKKLVVVSAGSFMHLVIAFALLWGLNSFIGWVPIDTEPTLLTKVGSISELRDGSKSPAQKAGFRIGDEIVAIDGQPVKSWTEVPRYIQPRPGKEIVFTIERDGKRRDLVAVPADLSTLPLEGVDPEDRPREPTGFVGIGPTAAKEKVDPLTGLARAGGDLRFFLVETVKALGKVVSPSGMSSYIDQLTGPPGRTAADADDVRFFSPVGLVRLADTAAASGLAEVMTLLVLINVFVGLFNMVPLPPLDGGHAAIAGYEAIRSRLAGRRYEVDMVKVMRVAYAVFVLLMLLAVTSLYLDLVRPLSFE